MTARVNREAAANPVRVRIAVVLLLFIHALLLGFGACRQSPTLDEPAQLVAGIATWQWNRFDLYCVNPPLVRMIAVLPVLAVGAETDWQKLDVANVERPEFGLGIDFVAANGPRSFWLMTISRWACVPFSLLGGWICFCWAKELFGNSAGLFSLGLWVFSPSVLGHAQLITTDVPAASMGITAAYVYWRWLKLPSWTLACLSGIALGLATLTKMTLLIDFGLWPVLWIVWRVRSSSESSKKATRFLQVAQLALMFLLAIAVINAGYQFQGSFSRLKTFAFACRFLSGADEPGNPHHKGTRGNRFADRWMGEIPIPLPKDFLLGFDLQKREFEDPATQSYLRGAWQERGWWYYYLYAFWVKTPLGLLCLAIALTVWRIVSRKHPISIENELAILLPLSAILVLVSSQPGFTHHLRYAFPLLPFAFIWLGQVVPFAKKHKGRIVFVAGMSLWSVSSSLWTYPHTLSYFNEAAGGPADGSRHLVHSDCDWGQDLFYLQDWLSDQAVANPIWLAYYANFDPRDARLAYNMPPADDDGDRDWHLPSDRRPEWLAVSVNFLRGLSRKAPDGRGGWQEIKQGEFDFLLDKSPAGRAGYSIVIYRLGTDD